MKNQINKSRKLLASIVLFLTAFATTSASALHVSVVGIGNASSLNSDPSSVDGVTLTTSSKFAFGGGALLGISLAPMVEFETGGLYLARKYEVTLSNGVISQVDTYSQHALEIPLLLRVWVLPSVSVGAGGYYAMGMGDIEHSTANPLGTTSSTDSYATANFKKNDYGALVSVGLKFPLSPGTAFLVDGRYALGLSDATANPGTPPIKTKYTDIQILAGLRFGM